MEEQKKREKGDNAADERSPDAVPPVKGKGGCGISRTSDERCARGRLWSRQEKNVQKRTSPARGTGKKDYRKSHRKRLVTKADASLGGGLGREREAGTKRSQTRRKKNVAQREGSVLG